MDKGSIVLSGKKVDILNASHAQKLGISTIYQELSVMPDLNAVQNIFLNRELTPQRTLVSRLKQKADEGDSGQGSEGQPECGLLTWTDLCAICPWPRSRWWRQPEPRTLMRRSLSWMKPTAALRPNDREQLFKVIRRLKEGGHSIIFISHHLDELMEICDRVSERRDGIESL